MMWTDDPLKDLRRYLREMDRREAALPKCPRCGDPVYDPEEELCEDCRKEVRDAAEIFQGDS